MWRRKGTPTRGAPLLCDPQCGSTGGWEGTFCRHASVRPPAGEPRTEHWREAPVACHGTGSTFPAMGWL